MTSRLERDYASDAANMLTCICLIAFAQYPQPAV